VPVILVGVVCSAALFFLALRFWERRSVAMNVRRINEAASATGRCGARVGSAPRKGSAWRSRGAEHPRELGVPRCRLGREAADERAVSPAGDRHAPGPGFGTCWPARAAAASTSCAIEPPSRWSRRRPRSTALGPIANDARAREKLEAEVRERHAALERARDAEAGAIARVDANPVDSEQVAGEAERLVTWQGQLAALKRRVRIYEKTLAAIEASESGRCARPRASSSSRSAGTSPA
jgi:hypothetical protein